jgi:hypothetical protein
MPAIAPPGARHDAIDRPARYAGKRGDRILDAAPFGNEQRPDEVGRVEAVLSE